MDSAAAVGSERDDNNAVTATTYRVVASGRADNRNEVLVATVRAAVANVVFFPGDVHETRARMMAGAYAEFSAFAYEDVAELLLAKFEQQCNVWIVRPAERLRGVFSCYSNFVTFVNDYGAATEYDPTGQATEHLEALMQDVQTQLEDAAISTDLPIHLVGFSKGGCVLNQLVTELAASSLLSNNNAENELHERFFSRVKAIHWVDSGNGSMHGALPSHDDALLALAQFDHLRIFVHATPYMYESKNWPWIKTEVHAFLNRMSFLGDDAQFILYYDGDVGSFDAHFQVLRDFHVHYSAAGRRKAGAAYSPEHAVQPVRIEQCK